MKKITYFLWFVLSVSCWGCNDDDNATLPTIIPEATGTMTDKEGNEYKWVRYNGLEWMTSNLRCGTPFYKQFYNNLYFIHFDNKQQALAEYDSLGNLYTYAQALEFAPEGWRLPSDEDWKKLEKALGMSPSKLDVLGWRGSTEGEILQQDSTGCGIHLLLSGIVSWQERIWTKYLYYCQVREFGYYWTSTIDKSYTLNEVAYFRRIGFYTSQIERNVTTIEDKVTDGKSYGKYMSVRYVRDAQ